MFNAKLEAYLDQLYGEPRSPEIDPMTIPCIETSDAEKLCKRPLVSVRIVTYNHEPYIRECLDSVVSQKTNFEFEILIGEDCSHDNTRAICFEYQKRYPEKIRVMWAHENVYHKGGNAQRLTCRCRGEYVAVLEGDDYWIDDRKLQKQMDAVRKYNAVACFSDYAIKNIDGSITSRRCTCGQVFRERDLFSFYPHTASYLFSKNAREEFQRRYSGVRIWYDVAVLHCLVDIGKVAYVHDVMSIYRVTGKGVATSMDAAQKRLLCVKQYLDLYLHGPLSARYRFGALVVNYIGLYLKDGGAVNVSLQTVVRSIVLRQFWHGRTVKAFYNYLRYLYRR